MKHAPCGPRQQTGAVRPFPTPRNLPHRDPIFFMNLKTLSVGCHGDRTVDAIVEIDPVTPSEVGKRIRKSRDVSMSTNPARCCVI